MTNLGRGLVGVAFFLVAGWPVAGRAADPSAGDFEGIDLVSLLDTPASVWTATKTEQKTSEAPAIITTVTREQIAVWGYRSVSEVLSHLLGFYVVDDHTSPNLAVRGISGGLYADSSIVKVLIDGHSVAFHSTGGNWLGPELIPLSAIERIEVVRGPASALFGADAFLGVINIKTRSGKSLNGGTAWLTAGRAGEKLATDADVSAGMARGRWDFMIAARRSSQDLSGMPLPSSPNYDFSGGKAENLDQQSTSLFARVTFRPREGTELTAFGYHSALKRGTEFGSLFLLANGYAGRPTFSQNQASLNQQRAGLLWDQALGGTVRLSVRGSLFQGAPGDSDHLEVGSDFYYVRRQFGFRGGDFDGQVEWTPGWAPRRSVHLVAGASAFADDEQLPSRIGLAKEAGDAGQPGEAVSIFQGHKTFLNTGAYLQGMWSVFGSLLGLTGGLRYDQHNIYGRQLSERVAIVSNPLPRINAKLLYGSAFKAPSPTLLYAVPAAVGDVVGNPDHKPQYVSTGELQLSWEATDFLSLSSDVAYSTLSNKTEFVQQGINQVARNVAHAGTLSWESLAEIKHGNVVRGHLSFEMQRTVRRTGQVGYSATVVGTEGGIYPTSMVHAGVVGQPPGFPVRAAVQASYIGSRRPSDTNILLNGGPYTLPSYFLLEAGLSTIGLPLLGPGHEISFALTGKNLLGSTGPVPGFSGVDYPLAPRSFFLQTNITL
jgi:outer membrane receptor for ferrienterochelin and colicins